MRSKFADIVETGKAQLALHEKQDERRHRQNLVRFTRIGAMLGINDIVDIDDTNGDHG